MTATSAGSSSSLTTKGLDISLAALKRQDPYINNIVDVASQVALYTYNNSANEWEKTEVEGTLFIYTRLACPRHGFTIMNRLSMENLTEPITKDLDFQLQDPFLLYRNARLVIHGIWFYDKDDCQRIAQRMKILTQQEQAQAQSQGGWLSPGGRGKGGEAKVVDIIQMLTKARTDYDKEKCTSEPKEIGGSSVLCGNPNLIKPIPVKPSPQENESAEPKSLSLATLFGSQYQQQPSKFASVPLEAVGAVTTGNISCPPVAHTLKYDDTSNSARNATSNGGHVGLPGGSEGGVRLVVRDNGGNAVAGLLANSIASHHQRQQPNQSQHCPAIAKLMQGQRGVGSVLHTVSESPENRLCDNGVPLEHHHHHNLYQLLQHRHQQQQLHPDPIKRLFQTQPPPPAAISFSSAAASCCLNAPVLQQGPHLSSQPVIVDSLSCSHLQPQQKQMLFNLSLPQPEVQHNSQMVSAEQGTGLVPSQVTCAQVFNPQGLSSQMPGVVSPHELLQRLQLVQQEQSLASDDPPQPSPGLAPRFLGPTQNQGSVPNPIATTAGQKAPLQFQVISPQRIPATVAPTLLLSPSVFTQTKSSGGFSVVAQDSGQGSSTLSRLPQQEESRVLSKSQLQATLLHLIQTDSSFVDSIYEAYISRFDKDSNSKY
ncbi:mRNA-decapping enzyme 1B [Pholidichthys leucotaenia]